jgi:uncharacterized membrane protein YoaT (DUF817 family)
MIATLLYIIFTAWCISLCKDDKSRSALLLFSIVIGVFILVASNNSGYRCNDIGDCQGQIDEYSIGL